MPDPRSWFDRPQRAGEEGPMNKKEFNVFFIEDPARNTTPFRIAVITRYEDLYTSLT